ncbi:DUF1972 domain-containing protein [Microbacterium sp. STN6]|uniref:DUF1972 domain-containing protein n=1 Tax=Microbacterium sp. STN6 TaxID=2995588 RepID=UPI002260DD77|nr:DUF1972 domain-containing protein [Microbacterium sp. STN6]MCX7523034.1 DUF1972 domain-containing protein [Microbacterium sp. STN6]
MPGQGAGGDDGQRARLRIAMIGTRGVPAAYGGFETAIEEIGSRLARSGHDVTVYCRSVEGLRAAEFLGMRLIYKPALRLKAAETLSHSALSVAHTLLHQKPDVAFVFNAANAPFLLPLRSRRIPVVVHVDGLEWKRDKWGTLGKAYYRWAEGHAVRWADALIADAQGISDYYRESFGVPTELISYGAKVLRNAPRDRLHELGLEPGRYHLVVARFEPENHVDVITEGFRLSSASLPLVVVGAAPYAAEHSRRIASTAVDSRIRLVGAIYDQGLLDQLYANAFSYLHGHSVGGTNPSLLRAMGAGTAVMAWDVVFNHDVAGPSASYFSSSADLARLIEAAEASPQTTSKYGAALQLRAATNYRWDAVSSAYEELAMRLRGGYSSKRLGHRRKAKRTGSPTELPMSERRLT